MKPATAALVLAFGLVTADVHAAGLNLAWDACLSEGGVSNKNFACNTNTGNRQMIGSIVFAQSHAEFCATDLYVYLQTSSAAVPDWWMFLNPGTCRQTSVVMNTDFTAFPATACQDLWAGNSAVNGIAQYATPSPDVIPGTNTARIVMISALPPNGAPVTAGVEYYAFRLIVNNAKTTGVGACAGCSVSASLLFAKAVVHAFVNGAPEVVETIETPAQNFCIGWQGGSGLCGVTAAPNRTWGQIKGLYR